MECVMRTLNMFCNMSGKEVSQEKTSLLFSKNVNRNMHNKLVNLSGYRVTSNLGKYLGVPIRGKMLRKNDFNYLVDQITAKLVSWKKNRLSFAGRITLAKSVIEAMPIYLMMTNRIPKAIINEIHRIQWLRNLESLNTTSIMKLGWKIATNAKDIWYEVMYDKYVIQEEFKFSGMKAGDSSLWKEITKVSKDVHKFGCWHVRDGTRICACEDNWLGEELQHNAIQHLISNNLVGARVVDLVNNQRGWSWSLLDSWLPMKWKDKICACLPPCIGQDANQFYFAGTANGEFSLKKVYQTIEVDDISHENDD
ncbi:hypothetical protein KIW84_030502 [Lathyrus oleraceus]|uniref:Uncharacterized protein n=1 Tax=Pisum sativum TaxID=3888 RepID=A0A9D4XN95_PEA|nr:hypothetical protein KIW84_030502 [Pisum sativum]